MYPKDTEKWKQFTTYCVCESWLCWLLCIPKILKNESNSQQYIQMNKEQFSCCVSQRYWKMKAIHNLHFVHPAMSFVVVYPKDTEKWKQFTTWALHGYAGVGLLCIPKILKNESNSQRIIISISNICSCCVSQRYWKMKAIHNRKLQLLLLKRVVVYPKDTEKWKQFTTYRPYSYS